TYYNQVRNYFSPSGDGMELDDEIKTPYSYRYWAFVTWIGDLRKRLLGQPVFPVSPVYDRDGTILSDKEFTDIFHQVHHVWHPNGGVASWTQATPGFQTSVGQHRRKKQISRAQVGWEFFAFHRDHLLIFDRWLARTGQDPVQSINTCAHDTTGGALPAPPAGLDVIAGGSGHPVVNYVTRAVDFTPPHNNMWDGTRPGFDGTLREFASVGEMGQFFALDFNPFPFISVPAAAPADAGYHGDGHVLNGDLIQPVANNYVPRFYAWHGFIDDLWTKRQPRFVTFAPVQTDGSSFPDPQVMTILRDFATNTDSVEPATAIPGLDLTTGNGTVRVKVRVRADPFNRPLELKLTCGVLREAGGSNPVITLTRDLIATPGPPVGANERQQNVDFIEEFVFDGSAGTVDGGGKGPFATSNGLFPPAGASETGFLNSLIRVTGYLTCVAKPDGSVPAAAGTIASAGTAVTGSGTSFSSLFREGDLIRANGQVRMVTTVGTNTSLAVYEPFAPNLPAGTVYERLDGFDHEEIIEIPLVQEALAPAVTVYLDRSSFSKDQVDAIAAAGQSQFEDSFYVVLQDRTERPAPIAWPAEVEPLLRGLIAPPVRAAGLYTDPAHFPAVELRDVATNASLAGQIDVAVTAADAEDAALHPSTPQRVTYRCEVTFTGNTAFAGMIAGDTKDLKLVITAIDRSGNRVVDESARVRLQVSANPYMLDGPTSWLSIDTRVFKVTQGQARFGVAAGWSDPNVFIAQAIDNLRLGNGTAGGESFDTLPTDQQGAVLEYSTQVGGSNVYNFALAKVRLQSVTGAVDVRTSFRLFRWGTANVSFDPALAYRSAGSGVALLGRTTTDELASVPFFAGPRVATATAMTTQPDPKNLFSFSPTGGGEALSFFGAYLDINQSALRFPHTFQGDGGFGGVPAADMRSIRDLLISQHQCMVVETVYTPDPTVPGATPGTSDNLSQRNLLILQTANPGTEEITRTVQHSFNIDLSRRCCRPEHAKDDGHGHEHEHAEVHDREHEHEHEGHGHEEEPDHDDAHEHRHGTPVMEQDEPAPLPARPAAAIVQAHDHHGDLDHLTGSWLEQAPNVLKDARMRGHMEAEQTTRWQIDPDVWKPTDGLDELVFFWNNLPAAAIVEVFLPGASAEEIVNYRALRHAPGTVKIVDSHTLRLSVAGPTYLPIPPFWGENLAGLVTVSLPKGIRAGEQYVVDVLQMRADRQQVLGGFQLNIQVDKAGHLIEPERRLLELFHKRLSLTPAHDRWRPILERQAAYARQRTAGFIDLARDPDQRWEDPTARQQGQKVRVVLEGIQILDDRDAGAKDPGEFRFRGTVFTRNNGGLGERAIFPERGFYQISDQPRRNAVALDLPLFEGYVEDHLAVEVDGIELDGCVAERLCRYRRVFSGAPASWLGSYGPGDELIEAEDLGGWRLWYRIERG
ncbi:MAG: hypothetical protein ACRDJH_06485, partial [Thermomicrobiales bacterium]